MPWQDFWSYTLENYPNLCSQIRCIKNISTLSVSFNTCWLQSWQSMCSDTANQSEKSKKLLTLFTNLTQPNQTIISAIIDHLFRVNQFEEHNKMSLHNLATVFGPTMLRPGSTVGSGGSNNTVADSFTAGTIDVMAQAGILYFFLRRKSLGHPLTNTTTETELWAHTEQIALQPTPKHIRSPLNVHNWHYFWSFSINSGHTLFDYNYFICHWITWTECHFQWVYAYKP